MLRAIISGNMQTILLSLMAYAVVIVISLPLHELAHAIVANKLGDPTAKNMGRITLNPMASFDPIGTTMILIAGFGWAKPVMINPLNFKNRKNGMALTALAGPVMNFLLAFISILIYKLVFYFAPAGQPNDIIATVFIMIAEINLTLAAFNLLPIPPLDGSKIIAFFMPMETYRRYEYTMMKYQQQIFYGVLFVIFLLPRFTRIDLLSVPLDFLTSNLLRFIDFLTSFVDLIAKAVGA